MTWTTADSNEQDALYEKLVSSSFDFVMPPVLAHLEEQLRARSRLQIGDTWVTHDGIWFEVKALFSSRQQRVDWSRVETNMQNGVLTVYDRFHPEVKAALPLASTLNAFALKIMVDKRRKQLHEALSICRR